MYFTILKRLAWLPGVVLIMLVTEPSNGIACACGCNVFTVGNKWMMATSPGWRFSFQYSFMNQNTNWKGSEQAPADSNADKEIRTTFYTLGAQYMMDRTWGFTLETPLWERYFSTIDDDGSLTSATHFSLGDMRVLGMYSGISEDMSTSLSFGLKLPTGPTDQAGFDRDTQIGSGTTDLILGGYRMGQESSWGWYAQAMWQHALNTKNGYRPGDSFDVDLGFHYDKLANSLLIIPIVQVVASFRDADSGVLSEPDETGYQRLYVVPTIEVNLSRNIQIYTDIRLPFLTNVTGNQLVAPALLNASVNVTI
jgi:hypothetical protein